MDQEDPRVAFIRARLDEDEKAACAGEDACWHFDYCDDEGEAFHNRFDPARMLRRVEALRKLLDAHLGYYLDGDDENLPIRTVTILAGIWSDHEDYAALFPVEVSQ